MIEVQRYFILFLVLDVVLVLLGVLVLGLVRVDHHIGLLLWVLVVHIGPVVDSLLENLPLTLTLMFWFSEFLENERKRIQRCKHQDCCGQWNS